MKSFGYCKVCMSEQDFEILEIPIPEVIEEWKKKTGNKYGNYVIPNGLGYNIIFKCMQCGNNKK